MSKEETLRAALRTCIELRLTFAAFRIPGEQPQIWAQRMPELETVDGALMWELNEVFVLAPFDLDPGKVPFIRSDVELEFGEFGPDIDPLKECVGSGPHAWSMPAVTEATAFQGQVDQARAAIMRGEMEKVVLSRVMHTPIHADHAVDLFLRALREQPHAFVAMANTPEHGLWLGATPERLVLEEEDHVTVDALAGTMKKELAPAEHMAWGAKERHEQAVVTDAVLDTFKRLKLQNIHRGATEVLSSANIAHLRTRIEGDMGESTLSDLVMALHPTPAVCGMPADKARGFIRTHEAHDRGLYAGFWGPWNPDGRTELYVNIRCLRVFGNVAMLLVGAGITAGSDPQREWEETEHKAAMWLRPIMELEG
jgi:isochorismate synthase